MTRHVRYMSGIWYILIYIYISIYIWYTVYIYINMLYVYIKISIHQNVKPGRTAVRWHPLAPAAHRSAEKKQAFPRISMARFGHRFRWLGCLTGQILTGLAGVTWCHI